LPKAIRAPTPTSALVHSSTLVTAGLVLLITYRELVINSYILMFITFAGFFTILLGSLIALREKRVKKLVAYRTLSQMGLGIIVYGLGQFYIGYYNLITHGFAKSLLFIQVGYLIHVGSNQQN
jgi:NADH:ubiquinone oxidoreductase subunit 5 (subunit L)/multisubunit Na+/H+ antiporter MnhA subunit